MFRIVFILIFVAFSQGLKAQDSTKAEKYAINYTTSRILDRYQKYINHSISFQWRKNIVHFSSEPNHLIAFEKYIELEDSKVFHFRMTNRIEHKILDLFMEYSKAFKGKDTEYIVSSHTFRGGRPNNLTKKQHVQVLGFARKKYFKTGHILNTKIQYEFTKRKPIYFSGSLSQKKGDVSYSIGLMYSTYRAKSYFIYLRYLRVTLGTSYEWNLDQSLNNRRTIWLGYNRKF